MTKELDGHQTDILLRIMRMLDSLGCTYVIKEPNGKLIGDISNVVGQKERKPRAPSVFSKGEVRAYVKPLINGIAPGEKIVVPSDKYGAKRIQATICAIMSEQHGSGMYQTHMRKDGSVELDFNLGL